MPSPVRWISGNPASACRLRSCSVTAGCVRFSWLAADVIDPAPCTADSARSWRMVRSREKFPAITSSIRNTLPRPKIIKFP